MQRASTRVLSPCLAGLENIAPCLSTPPLRPLAARPGLGASAAVPAQERKLCVPNPRVRAWWPAAALLPPLTPWGCSGSTGPGRTLEWSWGYAVTAPRREGRQRGEVLRQEGIREKVLPPECRWQQSRSVTGPLASSWDPQRTVGRDPYLKAVVSHPRKAGPMLLSFRRRLSCGGERFHS